MIEAPEAVCLSRQLNDAVCGKYISEVVVFHSPHKFTFISPGIDYEGVLLGKRVGKARARGGMVELAVGERALLFSDGEAPVAHRVRGRELSGGVGEDVRRGVVFFTG